MPTETEAPLLQALPLIQKVVLSSYDRPQVHLTKTQTMIMSILLQKQSLTMTEIAAYISSSNEQATRAVAPLVKGGFLERFILEDNRSRIHIRLSERGTQFMLEREKKICQCIAAKLDGAISPAEKQELLCSLNAIIRILNKVG